MNTSLESEFWSTRNAAKDAYIKWRQHSHEKGDRASYYQNEYRKAWEKHQQVNMAYFLEECNK